MFSHLKEDAASRFIYATTLEALLTLEGEEFIECCFQTLLNRQPAPDEKNVCPDQFMNSDSKMSLIARLVESGGGHAVLALPGLESALNRFKLFQLPVVGYLFQFLYILLPQPDRSIPLGRVIRLTSRGHYFLSLIEIEADKYNASKSAA